MDAVPSTKFWLCFACNDGYPERSPKEVTDAVHWIANNDCWLKILGCKPAQCYRVPTAINKQDRWATNSAYALQFTLPVNEYSRVMQLVCDTATDYLGDAKLQATFSRVRWIYVYGESFHFSPAIMPSSEDQKGFHNVHVVPESKVLYDEPTYDELLASKEALLAEKDAQIASLKAQLAATTAATK